MNPLYHRHQSYDRPGAQWRNPAGVLVTLIVGAALWSCICGALAAVWSLGF